MNPTNIKVSTAWSLFHWPCYSPDESAYHLNSSRQNTNLFWKEPQMFPIRLNINATLARDVLHLNRVYAMIQRTIWMSTTTNLSKPKRKNKSKQIIIIIIKIQNISFHWTKKLALMLNCQDNQSQQNHYKIVLPAISSTFLVYCNSVYSIHVHIQSYFRLKQYT